MSLRYRKTLERYDELDSRRCGLERFKDRIALYMSAADFAAGTEKLVRVELSFADLPSLVAHRPEGLGVGLNDFIAAMYGVINDKLAAIEQEIAGL